ncbi:MULTISPECIES: ZinT/AdcA family metal-binding protein [Aerococcus]|uniref:ZinT/AdcA family metal-binding protein n=2 Tax=Aerococcus TaxID=1375 RepID=A0A5N1GIP6_9LACT|nr:MULTISPECIES: ZinT/AdcA family metal-binding protein [Aerococcus]KAA9300632.1 ZinT/AdcA family metal-binding protein [Aerococcus sanguinicola]MDK6370126.1 ZinT/AdcA family metal-binding protein [Aerococcus sp. UMB9870]MDK6680070.1 ZinT/AdcA family metal-binding protein [Aerococcus sp. UMB8608]MDK6686231.1 ZinT/AdcA family metal-binding protein [Aerococcus sp. UMB8623]MDK6939959.1 ZinT/AdcA family metal-binding protein [Aerococcus sp. UMB8487]
MKRELLTVTLLSALALGACQPAEAPAKEASSSQTEQAAEAQHGHDGHNHDHDHGHDHEGHDHEFEVTKENLVGKEGDDYLMAHGDHYHQVPADQLTEEERKDFDDYLAAHPNLKADHEKALQVQAGYFDDADVADRTLADWQGDWQSVEAYLADGTLDPVMELKAVKSEGEKSAEDYKKYYQEGYKTDLKAIQIDGDQITFIKKDGSTATGTYRAEGSKILDYEKGNRGVRPLFTKVSGDDEAYNYVQFSDHHVAPSEGVNHFHIFVGNDSHQALFEQMANWPTFYPKAWTGEQIREDQLHH